MSSNGSGNPDQEKPKPEDKNPAPSGGSDNNEQPKLPNNSMKFTRSVLLWMMLITILLLFFFVLNGRQQGTQIRWKDFCQKYEENHLKRDSVVLRSDRIEAKVSDNYPGDGPKVFYVKIGHASDWFDYVHKLTDGDFDDVSAGTIWLPLLINLIPWILIFALIWFFLIRSIRGAGGGAGMFGSFGRSRHRVSSKEHTNITFDDVAGIDEAKEELVEIVEFLKSPKRFKVIGGRIPRGVLLSGLPGCGKTLLAKAIAGEAEVPFFSISGSDFVEMFVGVGASRVRDLFKQAKESSPCIIFLDEIDAVGRKRGSGFVTGGNDEREQTLNAILVEMDGFETNDQVIVIAATNRSDVLDPALTRPGRFDRQVMVPLPDLKGRADILKVHSRDVRMSHTIDMEKLARGTPMFTGADLAAIINEAALIATLAGKEYVEQEDLEEARDKIKFGRSRKSRVVEEKEKIATAFHEAGHAVIQALLDDADPLHKVTIIPRGNYGGATFSLPEKDRYGYGLKYLTATMRVMCAGRIAEERATSDISSGAAQDIAQTTTFARMMVLEWGMSDKLGFVRYGTEDNQEALIAGRNYSDDTARIIDEEIKRFADEAFKDTEKLVFDNWEKVEAVADALIRYETLTADEVHRLMRGEILDKPTVGDLLDAEKLKNLTAADSPGKTSPSVQSDDEPESDVVPSPA